MHEHRCPCLPRHGSLRTIRTLPTGSRKGEVKQEKGQFGSRRPPVWLRMNYWHPCSWPVTGFCEDTRAFRRQSRNVLLSHDAACFVVSVRLYQTRYLKSTIRQTRRFTILLDSSFCVLSPTPPLVPPVNDLLWSTHEFEFHWSISITPLIDDGSSRSVSFWHSRVRPPPYNWKNVSLLNNTTNDVQGRSLFLTHVLVGSSQARVINDMSPIFHWLSQLAVHERTYPRLALVQKERRM